MPDAKQLIVRNLEEVITEQELDNLLASGRKLNAYAGYEPSGPVHLGHFMSIRKLKDLQEAGVHVKVLMADYHAWLNRKGTLAQLEKWSEYWIEVFKALGLNAEFVMGSDYQTSREYVDDLFDFASRVTINRALRSMQQVARDIENARVSQIVYPLMQALDIKYLNLDIAVGGIEQRKIHMIAREFLPQIGWRPPVCLHHPLIVSLKGPEVKMSSSVPDSLIAVNDSPDDIRRKIQHAYCPAGQVEDNPIMQIARYLVFPELGKLEVHRPAKFGGDVEFSTYADLEAAYRAGLHPLDLKNAVADAVIQILAPAREIAFPKIN